MRNKILKRIVSILIILVMIFTPTAAFADDSVSELDVPTIPGLDWAMGKIFDRAYTVVDTQYINLLKWIDDNTDIFILNFACEAIVYYRERILSGKTEDKTMEMLEHISAQLDALDDDIKTLDKDINSYLNKMFAYEISHDAEEQHKNINEVYNKYSTIIEYYGDYIDALYNYTEAVKKYGENPTEKNEKAMNSKEKSIDTKAGIFEKSVSKLDYEADIRTLAKNTCEYYPSYKKNAAPNKDKKVGGKTYLGLLEELMGQTTPFDHEKEDVYYAGVNDSVKCFTGVIQVAKLELSYSYANGTSDRTMVSEYVNNANRAINAINDVSNQVDDTVIKLVRDYDLDTTKKMDYYPAASHNDIVPIIGKSKAMNAIEYSTVAQKTTADMNFYRVGINDTTYLVQKDYNLNAWDMVLKCKSKQFLKAGIVNAHCWVPTQDFYNLSKTKDGSYNTIKNPAELKSLLDFDGYSQYDDISQYLHQGGLSAIPSHQLKYVFMNNFEVPKTSSLHYQTFPVTFNWLTMDVNKSKPEKSVKNIDAREVYPYENLLVIMGEDKDKKEKYDVKTKVSDDRGTIAITDTEGKALSDNIIPKTEMKITVKIKDGASLKSLDWISADGKTVKSIGDTNSFEYTKDGKTNTATFYYPMSYQNCTIKAEFTTLNGSGTENDPYLIGSTYDFNEAVRNYDSKTGSKDVHYQLTADIDLSVGQKGYVSFPRTFQGYFDGNGFTIHSPQYYIFEEIGSNGKVYDLNVEINDDYNLSKDGIFVLGGYNEGLIDGCTVYGVKKGYTLEMKSSSSRNGVITGLNRGIIRNSGNQLNVSANKVAAIAGANEGKIINCYNTGELIPYSDDSKRIYGLVIDSNGKDLIVNSFDANNASPEGSEYQIYGENSTFYYVKKANNRKADNERENALEMDQINGSDYLLDILNSVANKNDEMINWVRAEGYNNFCPYQGSRFPYYEIKTCQLGSGDVQLYSGKEKVVMAKQGVGIQVKAKPSEGYRVANITILDENKKELESLKFKTNAGGKVTAKFIMPNSEVIVKVVFTEEG